MRFQKLSENKLKIILSNEELPNSSNLDDFILDSSMARHSFLEILDKAYDEVGFNTKDYKIKIDAIALKNGNFVFTVTKLIKTKKPLKTAKPKKILKNYSTNYAIYKFEKFDDFCNFCLFLNRSQITSFKDLAKYVELYKYNNDYYLSINDINENYENIAKFYSSITEFCKYFSSKDLFKSVLEEKGDLIIKNNAIEICQKHFSK